MTMPDKELNKLKAKDKELRTKNEILKIKNQELRAKSQELRSISERRRMSEQNANKKMNSTMARIRNKTPVKIPGSKRTYAIWIYVSDLERSKIFYQDKIGLNPKFQHEDRIEFDSGTTSFGIMQRSPEKRKISPGKTGIVFETKDIKRFHNGAIDRGIKLIGRIRNEDRGCFLTFEDPDGHWLDIFQSYS